MSIKTIVTTLIAAFLLAGCAGSATKESTGEYIDSATITTKVKSALLSADETKGTAIQVETFKGTVQLSGFVDSETEKQRAGEIAAAVDGVKGVQNNISVKN